VHARAATWRLLSPISREVVLTAGKNLEVVGGLTRSGVSSTDIVLANPATGTTQPWGHLANAVHDAAGVGLAGAGYVFGGGDTGSTATVQRLRPHEVALRSASLPRARSDLSAVSVAGVAYLVGGYDGSTLTPAVLKSTDGTHFTAIASLPVPVRYPAIAAVGAIIWTFGGQSSSGPTSVIQRIDLRSGRATVAGHLPSAVSGATALLLGGQIYLCGGTSPAGVSDEIRRFDTATDRTTVIGHLPSAVSNAASAVLGDTGYLLGGETPATTATVTILTLAPNPHPTLTR
jgi:hypothetical protein